MLSWRCPSSEEEAAQPSAWAVGTAFPSLALPQVSQLTSGKRLRNSDSSAPQDRPSSQSGVTWLAELPPSFSPSPGLSHHQQTGSVPPRPAEGSTQIHIWVPRLQGFPGLRCGLAQRPKGVVESRFITTVSGALAPCAGHPGSMSPSVWEGSDTSLLPPNCFIPPAETVQEKLMIQKEGIRHPSLPLPTPQSGMRATGLSLQLEEARG